MMRGTRLLTAIAPLIVPVIVQVIVQVIVLATLSSASVAAEGSGAAGLGMQPSAQACVGPGALVTVRGLKDQRGRLRIEIYADKTDEFLASRKLLQAAGRFFQRVDVDIDPDGITDICVTLPSRGRYSMAVLHDRDANGKLNVFNDGFGFPGNPKLGMSKPPVEDAVFVADEPPTAIDVVLNYWNRFGASPIKTGRIAKAAR